MADTASTSPKPAAPRSHRAIKLFIMLVLVAFLGALLWVTYLNWSKDGRFSFRIFDTSWWRPGVDAAQPVIDHARSASDRAGDALWGDDGLVDQAAQWWGTKQEARAKAEPKPSAPTAPPSDDLKRCERAIADAEIDFQYGLDHYRMANPRDAGTAGARREHLRQARSRFLSTRDLLGRAIDPYAKADGHDAERLADAKALQLYNDRLIASLDKLLEVP